jgi:hypothetical protein
MKKITFILFAILGIGLLFSCEKQDTEPVLDMSKTTPPSLTMPEANSAFVLMKAEADSMITFSWSSVSYNLTDLENTKYTVQIDLADSNFIHAADLGSTTATMLSIKQSKLNNTLLSLGATPESPVAVTVRVSSIINNQSKYTQTTSAVLPLSVTTYNTVVEAPPLYLIGDGSSVGWNNAATDLPFVYDDQAGVYKIVATLLPNKFIKAIEIPGQWAPQWGTDASGTSVGGTLVYRPTEDVPDPAAIPTPAEEGDYMITFDLVNFVYTIEVADVAQSMHIIGDATEAGWNNAAAIPMDKVSPGVFKLVANLSADATEGFKFLVNQGAWAPMYGTVEGADFESGELVYRETEDDPDPKSIPPPSASGQYIIKMNTITMTYTVTPPTN